MMSAEKYAKAAVENVKIKLSKSNCRLPSRYDKPMSTTYYTSEDESKEMNAEGLQVYEKLIGILFWAVDIGRVDILLELSLLLSQLALPRLLHIHAVYRVFGYLKQVPKRKLYFDPR